MAQVRANISIEFYLLCDDVSCRRKIERMNQLSLITNYKCNDPLRGVRQNDADTIEVQFSAP